MRVVETFDLPMEIQEGWGMARDTFRPNIMYVSDGSNTIYECDVTQQFKVVKTHEVVLADLRKWTASQFFKRTRICEWQFIRQRLFDPQNYQDKFGK